MHTIAAAAPAWIFQRHSAKLFRSLCKKPRAGVAIQTACTPRGDWYLLLRRPVPLHHKTITLERAHGENQFCMCSKMKAEAKKKRISRLSLFTPLRLLRCFCWFSIYAFHSPRCLEQIFEGWFCSNHPFLSRAWFCRAKKNSARFYTDSKFAAELLGLWNDQISQMDWMAEIRNILFFSEKALFRYIPHLHVLFVIFSLNCTERSIFSLMFNMYLLLLSKI